MCPLFRGKFIPIQYEEGAEKIGLRRDVERLVAELRDVGLFLVPVGELESWLPILMKGHSRTDKSQWAMLAAERIEDVGERTDDVWQFVRTVYQFLDRQLEATVASNQVGR